MRPVVWVHCTRRENLTSGGILIKKGNHDSLKSVKKIADNVLLLLSAFTLLCSRNWSGLKKKVESDKSNYTIVFGKYSSL